MVNKESSDVERRAWNSAINEAIAITEDETGCRRAYSPENSAGWDAACEWIGKRLEVLKIPLD